MHCFKCEELGSGTLQFTWLFLAYFLSNMSQVRNQNRQREHTKNNLMVNVSKTRKLIAGFNKKEAKTHTPVCIR